ncbi:MAG: (S)-benzoin forming benzil reductase [Clostridiales bacterium]|nr:(S)-benzoin forming benzil reductase [Clostridiales bacterium]
MNYYIITGTSRGLGNAIVKGLLNPDNYIFCISRTRNEELIKLASRKKVGIEYITFDLLDVHKIKDIMERIFLSINKNSINSITLINNAGILSPIKPIELCSSEEIDRNIRINLTAPMILTSSFISNTVDINSERRIINISSGAGKKPYYGWSNYCTSKSGIDFFTQCVAVEQLSKKNPVKIISFAPGIIDTDMQAEIRKSKKECFEDVERFISFKTEGKLLQPDVVADYVIKLSKIDINSGDILDIKQFQ